MFDWIAAKLAEVEQLIQLGAAVLAVVYVVSTWWRTKALVPTVTAMVLAGAVLWAINNIDWFERKVGEEAQSLGPALAAALRR